MSATISWQGPDEVWLLGQIADLQARLERRLGDNITVPMEVLTHAQSALISALASCRDTDRIRYLDDLAKRHKAHWRVICGGVVIGNGPYLRCAMDQAILHAEGMLPPKPSATRPPSSR